MGSEIEEIEGRARCRIGSLNLMNLVANKTAEEVLQHRLGEEIASLWEMIVLKNPRDLFAIAIITTCSFPYILALYFSPLFAINYTDIKLAYLCVRKDNP